MNHIWWLEWWAITEGATISLLIYLSWEFMYSQQQKTSLIDINWKKQQERGIIVTEEMRSSNKTQEHEGQRDDACHFLLKRKEELEVHFGFIGPKTDRERHSWVMTLASCSWVWISFTVALTVIHTVHALVCYTKNHVDDSSSLLLSWFYPIEQRWCRFSFLFFDLSHEESSTEKCNDLLSSESFESHRIYLLSFKLFVISEAFSKKYTPSVQSEKRMERINFLSWFRGTAYS